MNDTYERTVYLGRSTQREHIYAHVRVGAPQHEVMTFTDHTKRPGVLELGIMFTTLALTSPKLPPYEVADRHHRSGGQVPASDRRIITANPHVRVVEKAWEDWHLNTVNAACDHMTPEMLAYLDGETGSDWQRRMLDTVVCPETGYRWGRAWLAKEVPADVLRALKLAVDVLPEVRP